VHRDPETQDYSVTAGESMHHHQIAGTPALSLRGEEVIYNRTSKLEGVPFPAYHPL
jgi:hypothetical protein